MEEINVLKQYMVEELNEDLKNTCLKYRKESRDGDNVCYKLVVDDIFIGIKYPPVPNYTDEFERYVREYFKENFGVEDLGYSNNIGIIWTK